MQESIFTLKAADLEKLDATKAVSFFQKLIWAEARKLGIPLNNINISLSTNTPDGGIDARVDNSVKENSGLIKTGLNSYQIKTGNSFKPYQEKQVKKELFSEKKPNKENLGKSVKSCLDQNGTYIVVCFGCDLVETQRQQAIENFTRYFEECGYQNPKNVISFTQTFPSLILQLKEISTPFQTHKSWSLNADMNNDFVMGEKQREFIENVREANDTGPTHIRIIGEPGIGKTRLIFEATKAENLSPLVVYCDKPSKFVDSGLMNEILKEDNPFFVILILDECNANERSDIWNKIKNRGARIKIISIHTEPDDCSGNILFFEPPILANDQVSEILQTYGIPNHQTLKYLELCSGSPRVAHIVGWNLKNNPKDLLKPLDTVNIWERYIAGENNLKNEDVKQSVSVLKYISLFKKFGFGKEVSEEAKFIASTIEKANPQVTWTRFREIIQSLRKRKILQGDITLYISPKALHIHLWTEWWNTYGENFDIVEFSTNMPPELLEWFYEMFKYAARSEAASKVVEQLLSGRGPFFKDDFIKTQLGADFFLALSEANPKKSIICLKKIMKEWDLKKTSEFIDGRRQVIIALERIAIHKELFSEAARLLLGLAEAENEPYANNASGVFKSLFSLGHQTEISAQERISFLKEILNDQSVKKRILGLNACEKILNATSHNRIIDIGYQETTQQPHFWVPRSREEIINVFHEIWRILFQKLHDLTLTPDEQEIILEIFLTKMRMLNSIPELSQMIIADLHILITHPFAKKEKFIEKIEMILTFDKNFISEENYQKYKILRDNLVNTNFSSYLRRYAAMVLISDKIDEDGNRGAKTQEHIEKLVAKLLSNNDLLEQELPWLLSDEAINGYRFGYVFGKQDKEFSLLTTCLEKQQHVDKLKNIRKNFLSGYLRALFEIDSNKWEFFLEGLRNNCSLANWIPGLTAASGISDKAALRILNLAKSNIIEVGDFKRFITINLTTISESTFREWIEYLLASPEEAAFTIALDLYLTFYSKIRWNSNHLPSRDLTFRILTFPSFFKSSSQNLRNRMDAFNWKSLSQEFIRLYPADSINLVDIIFENFELYSTELEGVGAEKYEIINNIAKSFPDEVWQKLTKFLSPPNFHIQAWLRGNSFKGALMYFNRQMVWNWVEDDPNKRVAYLAIMVPELLENNYWVRELLIRYGDCKKILDILKSNFFTDMWKGSIKQYYQQKKQSLIEIMSQETNQNIKDWFEDLIAELDNKIDYCTQIEERDKYY